MRGLFRSTAQFSTSPAALLRGFFSVVLILADYPVQAMIHSSHGQEQ